MALTSNYAMPENWTALNVARKQKQQCAKDVQDIKTTCQAEHNTKHVAECRECFDKVLDRMFSRYKDNTDREWFLGRISVASSLEMIFTEAKERKATFNDIEENIGSEKEAWYRSVLRRHPEFLAVAQSGVDIDEVRALLDDPDRSRTELVAEVSKAVGMPKDWSDQVDKFAAEVAATEGDPAGLKQLYVREFFKDRDTGETLPHAQPYLDMYERDDSMTLEDVMDKITSARQEDRSIQAQLEKHQTRLDELKRAKMAFEQSRAQAKSKAQGAQGPQPNKQYYDLQCVVCGGQPKEPGQWNSCIVCQTIFEIGGDAPLRVRCSDECAGKDEDTHASQAHGCSAAERCVWEDDEDDIMEDESDCFVACNECLDEKQATLFCSQRCAGRNFPAHRKKQHGQDTPVEEIRDLVSPWQSYVDMILAPEKTGVAFERIS